MSNYQDIMSKDYGCLKLPPTPNPIRGRGKAPRGCGNIYPHKANGKYDYWRAEVRNAGKTYVRINPNRQVCVDWLNDKLREFGIRYRHF